MSALGSPTPRRAFSKAERSAILMRQAICGADDVWRASCEICEAQIATLTGAGWEPDRPHEFDHIISLGLGGEHDTRNARAICGHPFTCHKEKSALDEKRLHKAHRMGGGEGSQWARRAQRKASGKGPLIPQSKNAWGKR